MRTNSPSDSASSLAGMVAWYVSAARTLISNSAASCLLLLPSASDRNRIKFPWSQEKLSGDLFRRVEFFLAPVRFAGREERIVGE
jgi:hypothetical protein